MKSLLEAINKSILQELNNNIQLLSDIDSDDDNSQFNITSKSVNNNIESSHIVFKYEFINTIDSMLNFNDTAEKMRGVMNNPKNFNIFKGLVKATNVDHLKKLINIGKKLLGDDGNFNWIDTSNINDMYGLFYSDSTFNGHIELWDVSNVKNMRCMFSGAESFNQPIGDWDVSNVEDMYNMFNGAKLFNQPIGNWDVSNVEDMFCMFNGAESFNQPIGDWDVSNVTNMRGMFCWAESFNQPIGNWDVSNVTNMEGMFQVAKSFNQPIGDWDVSNVKDMECMFSGAKSFKQDLSKWKLKGDCKTYRMFNSSCPIKKVFKPKGVE